MTEQQLVKMRMVSAEFDYTYEYQGNAPKLVHTPLTDKCYLTLTQAMFMGYGGNPYGLPMEPDPSPNPNLNPNLSPVPNPA